MTEREVRKIEVHPAKDADEEEIANARDFSKIKTRFDEAKKPLPERKLFHYKQRWFFIALVLIILILLMLLDRI